MIDVAATCAGLILVLVAAILVPASLGIRGRAPFAVAALVTGAGDVVGSTIALSLPRWVTRPGELALMAVVAGVAVGVWVRVGRPRPPRIRQPLKPLRLGAAWILVAIAAAFLLVQFYVDMRVAPSNWDSMTYHLSRAAYWLQQHSALHYPGGTVRQLGSGPNAEIMVAWTMLLNGTDRWVELVQWVSLVGLGLTIFSGARLLKFSAPASAFAGALFCLLPQPLMQATTTQNDLVTSFFVAATALFVGRGLRDRHRGDLAVAGAALGLAVGTKGTALIALPALGAIAVGAWVGWRPPLRVVATGAALALAGVVMFGSFNYVLNYKNSHDALGGLSDQVASTGGARWTNVAHDLWTFADTTGVTVPWLQPVVQGPMNAVFGGTFGAGFPYSIDTGVQEDTSAFGFVGFLLLIPLLLVALLAPRSRASRRVVAAAVLIFLLVFSYRIGENAWLGRLYLPAVALAAPLFAAFGRRRWSAGVVAALALLSAVPSVFQNPQKQVLVSPGVTNVFAQVRLQQMSVLRPEMWAITEQVFRFAGPRGRIGYVGGEDSWDYPLFGAHRTHYVERMASPTDATYARMAKDRLTGVVFANSGLPPAPLSATRMGDDYYWVAARKASR